MPIIALAFAGIILFAIAYQDLKTRSVSWYLFPLLALSGGALTFSELRSPGLLLYYIAINCGFLVLQYLLLKLWLFLRNGRNTTVIDHSIGKGDLLFLLATCCFFSPVNFILFYMLSLLFSLLLYIFIRRWHFFSGDFKTVPLAGLQAGFLILVLPLYDILKHPLTDDIWILPKLT